jgi:hypothetical protein
VGFVEERGGLMGALAEMSASDRAEALRVAREVVEAVENDEGNPLGVVFDASRESGESPAMETLVLWLAQLALEAQPSHEMFNENGVSTPGGVTLHDCGDPRCNGFERGYRKGWNDRVRKERA